MYRIILTALVIVFVTSADAQTFLPGSYLDYNFRGNHAANIRFSDSTSQKKWFLSKYSGISTSFSFFNGGNATIVSAPMGLQLNRRLNNNLYAFAGVSIAPAYLNFRSSFINADLNKLNGNNSFRSGSLGVYSRAEMGLMYVNDQRTFSISGSFGVERNNFAMPSYMPLNLNQNNQTVPVKR